MAFLTHLYFWHPDCPRQQAYFMQKPKTTCKLRRTWGKVKYHLMISVSILSIACWTNTEHQHTQKTALCLRAAPWQRYHSPWEAEALSSSPCCLDTVVINSHYIHYKTIEIQDHPNPSHAVRESLYPWAPLLIFGNHTLTTCMGAQGKKPQAAGRARSRLISPPQQRLYWNSKILRISFQNK